MDRIFEVADIILQVLGGLSVIAGIIELIKGLISYLKKKKHIKRLFMFENGKCYISQSVFKKEATNETLDYITVNSMLCFQKLQFMLSEVGYKVIPFMNSYVGENTIHIGGPAANINVNSIFIAKKYKFTLTIPITNTGRLEKMGINTSCIEFTEDGTRSFKVGEKLLEIDEKTDYGVFIRIPSCKNDGIDYTTHIIFGGWANGTLNAVDFFAKNYKMIATKYKSNRYCFAIPISRINNSTELFRNDEIRDLTSDFFGDE